jgi:hypothetical protein
MLLVESVGFRSQKVVMGLQCSVGHTGYGTTRSSTENGMKAAVALCILAVPANELSDFIVINDLGSELTVDSDSH